jgi:hydroxymethylbilane synthase
MSKISELLQNPPSTLVIASRESRLAMWQAEHVRARLTLLYPQCDIKIVGMSTKGDQILDRTLSKVGGKGLFVKELEVAMAEGRADLAVHSLKDVPMELPDGFALAAVTPSFPTITPRSANCRTAPWSAPAACAARR